MPSNVDILSIGEAAKFLRVSVRTMQRWDISGRLKAERTPSDRRTYTRDQLNEFAERHVREYKQERTAYTEKAF